MFCSSSSSSEDTHIDSSSAKCSKTFKSKAKKIVKIRSTTEEDDEKGSTKKRATKLNSKPVKKKISGLKFDEVEVEKPLETVANTYLLPQVKVESENEAMVQRSLKGPESKDTNPVDDPELKNMDIVKSSIVKDIEIDPTDGFDADAIGKKTNHDEIETNNFNEDGKLKVEKENAKIDDIPERECVQKLASNEKSDVKVKLAKNKSEVTKDVVLVKKKSKKREGIEEKKPVKVEKKKENICVEAKNEGNNRLLATSENKKRGSRGKKESRSKDVEHSKRSITDNQSCSEELKREQRSSDSVRKAKDNKDSSHIQMLTNNSSTVNEKLETT